MVESQRTFFITTATCQRMPIFRVETRAPSVLQSLLEILTDEREVRAPAICDDEPGTEATPGADVFAAVGLDGPVGLADGNVVAADLDSHVGGVVDANGFETKILISGVAELVEQTLDGLGAVGEVVVRGHECAVGREESGDLVVVAGVEGGDEILGEVAD